MAIAEATGLPTANNPKLTRVSSLLKLLSDDTRARLILELRDGGLDVMGLASAMGAGRQKLSHPLRLFTLAGVVQSERDGRRVVHTLTEIGRQLLDAIDVLGRDPRPD
jgi:DNA-binding transcriptional ArsR family regulator